MENENVKLEEIKEGVPSVAEDVSKGNVLATVAIGACTIAIIAGGVVLIRKLINKRKASKTEVIEVVSEKVEDDNEPAE